MSDQENYFQNFVEENRDDLNLILFDIIRNNNTLLTGSDQNDAILLGDEGNSGNHSFNRGINIVQAGSGDDFIVNEFGATNFIYGGTGNDTFTTSLHSSQLTNQFFNGGQGNDTYNLLNDITSIKAQFLGNNTVKLYYTGERNDIFFHTVTSNTATIKNVENFKFYDGTYTYNELKELLQDQIYIPPTAIKFSLNMGEFGTHAIMARDYGSYDLATETTLGATPDDYNGTLKLYYTEDHGMTLLATDFETLQGLSVSLQDVQRFSASGLNKISVNMEYDGGVTVKLIGMGEINLTSGDGDDTITTIISRTPGPIYDSHYYINSGAGNDEIWIRNKTDSILDNATLNATTEIHAGQGDDTITVDKISNDKLFGGDGNDVIHAGFGDDLLLGGTGDDTLYGEEGNDKLYGNTGDDTLYGDDGDDLLLGGTGTDALYGGNGNDLIRARDDNSELYDGGAHTDTVWWRDSSSSVTVNLNNGEVTTGNGTTSTILNVENLKGSAHNDIFHGNTANNVLDGNHGNDILYGYNGQDWLYGRHGADTLYGGEDNDVLHGGRGDDEIHGGTGNDTLTGGFGNDTLYGDTGQNHLYGYSGADTFVFESATAFDNAYDFLHDFRTSNNDKIDISDLLTSYDIDTGDAITDFVMVTEGKWDSFLWVDESGSGTFGTEDLIAKISHVTNISSGGNQSIASTDDLLQFISNGNLIV